MTLGGTICSWGWCMFSIYYKETHCRLHLSCHVTTDLRLLPIGASRWPWCPNGILLGSPIWIPFTFTIMYYVHMWCAVFSSCLYISLSCILSILFLFTLRHFLIWVLDSKRGQKVFFKTWSNWSSVFVCLPLSLSPNCSLWYVHLSNDLKFGEPIPKRKSTRWRISLPFGGARIIAVDSTLANNANISQLGSTEKMTLSI